MRRLAVAVSAQYADYHPDDAALINALLACGLRPIACVWTDPNVAWETFDAVLIRTIWDYYRRYPQYLAWLAQLEHAGVAVVNPIPTLRWNADKRYLLELEQAGLPVIATRLADAPNLRALFEECGWDEIVLKPTVSAGAWDTLRIAAADAASHEAEYQRLRGHHRLIVQPYLARVAEAGEWSFIYFGDEFSHAVLKRPAAGEFRVQEKHGGRKQALAPGPGLEAQAAAILRALPELGQRDCLYARVDAVELDGRLALMELELIEPQLFLAEHPAAGAHGARVLATGLQRQLAR